MTTSTPHPKFGFDTVFDNAGDVAYAAQRPKRLFPAEEVEVLRAQAFAEGERQALASMAALQAQALSQIAASVGQALPRLAGVAHEHRVGAAELALACARAIADAALAKFPEAPIQAALENLAREIEASPRLIVSVGSDLAQGGAGADRPSDRLPWRHSGPTCRRRRPGRLHPRLRRRRRGLRSGRRRRPRGRRAAGGASRRRAARRTPHSRKRKLTAMSDNDLKLDEFGPSDMPMADMGMEIEDKTASDLAPVFDVPVSISAVLGRATMSVAQLLQLQSGSVLDLDRKVGEAIDIYVNNRLVARGEVVIVDDRLGVTMTEIIKDGDTQG